MMNILIKQGSVLHIQVNTTLELLTDVMYNQRYKFNQPDKIPVINVITTSRNRSQKIQSRIKKFKFLGSVRIIFLKWKMKKKILWEVNRKVNIIIRSDSHAHGLAGRLKVTLNDNFEVIWYTKPNCNVKVQLKKILLIYQRMMYTSS
jgi:hypothetical protein